MASIYTEPGSSTVHITEENNTHADLVANLDKCQTGIETDTKLFAFKDQNGNYFRCADYDQAMLLVGSTTALSARLYLDVANRKIKIQTSVDEGDTWVDTGIEWDI